MSARALSRPGRAVTLGGHPGCLAVPADARFLLLLAHGAGAGMRHPFMAGVSAALAAEGVATARFEFPYMAAGRPRPDAPTVAETTVREAWAAVRKRFPDLPAFAGGKSYGGRMTSRAHAAAPLEGVRGLVFLGFPLHPAGKPGVDRADHLEDAAGPLLFVQGERDALAELRMLRPVLRKLGRRATLHVMAGADHGFSVPRSSGREPEDVRAEIAGAVRAWMEGVTSAGGSRGRSTVR